MLTGTQTGPKEVEAIVQLHAYAALVGGKGFSAQAGFRLRDTSVVGPDASWISAQRLASLSPEATHAAFWRVCPEIVIEMCSESDTWKAMCRKIDRYIANGAGTYRMAADQAQIRRFPTESNARSLVIRLRTFRRHARWMASTRRKFVHLPGFGAQRRDARKFAGIFGDDA